MVNKVSIRRRTKKYKIKKRKKKTRKKGKKRKMKGGGLADKFLGFFNTAPKKESQNLENGKIVNGKIENGKIVNDQDKKNCPQQKGVFETINDFSKEQVNTLKNSLNDANAKIKKTATEQVGRTFSNIMNRMVEKSEKENVCPCCKRPYTDKEKVPVNYEKNENEKNENEKNENEKNENEKNEFMENFKKNNGIKPLDTDAISLSMDAKSL